DALPILGEGIIGMAAARCTPIRLGNLGQMSKYARTVRRSYEQKGEIAPGREVPVPGLAGAQSRVAVPAMALGQLVGVLGVDSREEVAFGPEDEALLTVVASMVGNAIEIERVASALPRPARAGPPRGGLLPVAASRPRGSVTSQWMAAPSSTATT